MDTERLRERVEGLIREHDLIAPGGDVTCLVSGGADSTCLWHVLTALTIAALTVPTLAVPPLAVGPVILGPPAPGAC